jgi:uncharacterized protein YciI
MSKIYAVLVETTDGYADYALTHPDHNQRQRAWFVKTANEGKLLACGPYLPHDGEGLWLLRADNREEAEAIVRSSPRHADGVLSMEKTRIVEWGVSIGKERFS